PLTCLFIHLFFFSFTIPRLPSSTLFPYTTLFPWGLGWRNVLRHRRVSVFLILTTALLVAVPFAIGTVAATATFSTEEVASTAMGQADVRARTTSYQTGIREDAPVPGVSGITGVIEDRDLQLRLEG